MPIYLIGAVLLGGSLYVHVLTGNAGDKNWMLLATRMWLEGKKLYIDIFDVNPPLIFWIYALPVYVSMHIPAVSDGNALAIFGLGIVALVIRISCRLIARHPEFANNATRRRQFAALLLFLFIFYTSNNFFFDREHIFLLLIFPYMLRFMPELARMRFSLPVRAAIGLLAAIGFCLKPYTLIVFAAVQLSYMGRERKPDILYSVENAIIYVCGIAYLLCIGIFTPDYITVVIPMALATYSGYRSNELLYPIISLIIYGVTFVDFRPRYISPYRKDIYYLLGMAAAFLCYALANNGWGYTYYPLIIMGLLLTAWVLWHHVYLRRHNALAGLPVQSSEFGMRACTINLLCNFIYALVSLVSFFSVPSCATNVECKKYNVLMEEIKTRHIHSFGVMSYDFHKWAQIGRASGAQWDTRFRHLWMLNKFIVSPQEFTRKNAWILDYLDDAYTDDLNHRKPDALFVESDNQLKLPWLFAHSQGFKEAWSHYRYLHRLDICGVVAPGTIMMPDCMYDVYIRRP